MQVSDAWYTLPSPYPEGQTVGAVKHTSSILNAATSQEVPLSEVTVTLHLCVATLPASSAGWVPAQQELPTYVDWAAS